MPNKVRSQPPLMTATTNLTTVVAVAVGFLAAAAVAEDLLLLQKPDRVIEAMSVQENGEDCVVATLAAGGTAEYCDDEIVEVIRGHSFLTYRDEKLAALDKKDYAGRLQLLRFTFAAGMRREGVAEADKMKRSFDSGGVRDNVFLDAVIRRDEYAFDPCYWLTFDYTEDVEEWIADEGEDAPRHSLPMEEFRRLTGFNKFAVNHGYAILGTYFFENKRGLSCVLLERDGSYPAGWPEWLAPEWTLQGSLLIQEATPNRFFDRIVQYHWHSSLQFRLFRAADPETALFEYAAGRIGKHSDQATSACEWASRRLFQFALRDEMLHQCPVLRCDEPPVVPPLPAGVTAQPDIHAELPPLYDPTPHYPPPQHSPPPPGISEEGAPPWEDEESAPQLPESPGPELPAQEEPSREEPRNAKPEKKDPAQDDPAQDEPAQDEPAVDLPALRAEDRPG